MTSDAIVPTRDDGPLGRLLAALERALSEIPRTDEPESRSPEARARIPDLVGIWKIQPQTVADMAGAFGRRVYLGREQMLYCLFRHAAARAMRDVVVRVGERMLIRRPALGVVERVLGKVGVRITQRLAGGAIARWLPIVGALGVGAYAYCDTGQVAETAIDLFRRDIDLVRIRRSR